MFVKKAIAGASVLGLVATGLVATSSPAFAETVTFGPGQSTWVVPAGIMSIGLETVGGGGGGAKGGAVPLPGGSGARVSVTNMEVTPGSTISMAVGTGGATPAVMGGGGGGGASIVYEGTPDDSGILMVAGGGGGGASGNNASAPNQAGANAAYANTGEGGSVAVYSVVPGAGGGSAGIGGLVTGSIGAKGDPGLDGLFGDGGAGGAASGNTPGAGGANGLNGLATGGNAAGNSEPATLGGGGGGGGGYGGGAGGGTAGQFANAGAAGGSAVGNAASAASGRSFRPASNAGAAAANGGAGHVKITFGSTPTPPNPGQKPGQPKTLKVSGKPKAKTRVLSWSAPKSGGAVTHYLVQVREVRTKKLVYQARVPASQRKVTLKRKALVAKTVRSRGEVAVFRYNAVVTAQNSAGKTPSVRKRFTVRV